MRLECKCKCGETVFIYPKEWEIYKNDEKTYVAHNGCIKCGSRVEAYISVNTIEKKER